MSDINNGGPAFPVPLNAGQSWQGIAPCDGMTLRDYFAAKAMQAMAAAEYAGAFLPDIWSRQAYELADAMLKAREAKQ